MSVQRHQARAFTLPNHGVELIFGSAGEVQFGGASGFDFDGEATISPKRYQISAAFHARARSPDHKERAVCNQAHLMFFFGGAAASNRCDAFFGAGENLTKFPLIRTCHGRTSLSIVLDNFG